MTGTAGGEDNWSTDNAVLGAGAAGGPRVSGLEGPVVNLTSILAPYYHKIIASDV